MRVSEEPAAALSFELAVRQSRRCPLTQGLCLLIQFPLKGDADYVGRLSQGSQFPPWRLFQGCSGPGSWRKVLRGHWGPAPDAGTPLVMGEAVSL